VKLASGADLQVGAVSLWSQRSAQPSDLADIVNTFRPACPAMLAE
jgi:hypothetical protein